MFLLHYSHCFYHINRSCFYVTFSWFHGLRVHFFLALNNIPLSGCTTVYLSSSTEGHFSCFQVLVIMNKAAIDIHVQILCGHEFSLTWRNSKEHNCSITWKEYVQFYKKMPNCLPKWLYLYHFAFSPAMNKSSYSTFSPAFGVFNVWDVGHSNR